MIFRRSVVFLLGVCCSCVLVFKLLQDDKKSLSEEHDPGIRSETNQSYMSTSQENCLFRSTSLLAIIENSEKTSLASDHTNSKQADAIKLRDKLAAIRKNGQKVRLSIGSSGKATPGLTNVDINQLNMIRLSDWEFLLGDKEVEGADNLFAEHVFEHLTPRQVLTTAAASFLMLRGGGRWRIAVPDAYFPDTKYQLHVRAAHTRNVQTHMVVWSKDSLPSLFEMMGYSITLLEYYDAAGEFHKANYSEEHGFVRRTVDHDKRNRGGAVKYTSLVFDAEKPEDCNKNIN